MNRSYHVSKDIWWIDIRFIAFFLVLVWCNTPCFGQTDAPSDSRERLVVGTPGPVVSLDPTNYRGRETQVIIKNIFDSLTTRDASMRVVPQLAESWKLLNDLEWEFKLRKGVKFHNGDKLTAEDVKYTLERIIKSGGIDGAHTSPRQKLLGPLERVDAVDALTVRLKTKGPWPNLPLMLSLQEIVPKNYMQTIGNKGFENAPVGAGPFRFVRKKEGELVLERFEDYYGGSPANPPVQKASVSQLVFRIMPSLMDRVAALKAGRCDLITHVTPDTLSVLKMSDTIRIMDAPATRSYFADLNCIKYPFNDRRIRQAINYAVNMEALLDHFLMGEGIVLPTILLPNAFSYHTGLSPYPYDPARAKALLREAGYPEWHSIQIYCAPKYNLFANALAVFLSKVGFKVQVKVVARDEARLAMVRLLGDILVTSWGNSTLDPSGILQPKLQTNGRGNFSHYSNKEVDALLQNAENAMQPKLRINNYKKIQEIIYEDAPMIFGYAAKEFYAVSTKVRNFIPAASGMLNLHDVSIDMENK